MIRVSPRIMHGHASGEFKLLVTNGNPDTNIRAPRQLDAARGVLFGIAASATVWIAILLAVR